MNRSSGRCGTKRAKRAQLTCDFIAHPLKSGQEFEGCSKGATSAELGSEASQILSRCKVASDVTLFLMSQLVEANYQQTVPSEERLVAKWHAYSREHWLLIAGVVVGVAARIAYWVYVHHDFEDALITDTHARNVVEGIGLTPNYAVGHVQGFTSALSVLIPLIGEVIHQGSGLDAMPVASIISFVVTAAFAYFLARKLQIGRWPTGFLLAYLALDYNNVMYGMSGMETQLAVAAIFAVAYFVVMQKFVAAGISIGLSLLARPDFLLIAVPAVIALLIMNYRRGLLATGLALVVVGPWIVFTQIYYGSVIPLTILAKDQAYTDYPPIGHTPRSLWHFITSQLSQHDGLWRYLAPFKESFSVVKAPISDSLLFAIAVVVAVMAVVGAFALRRVPGIWVVTTYVVLFALYKIFFLPPTYYEWYLPPFMGLLMLYAAAGLTRCRASGVGRHQRTCAHSRSYLEPRAGIAGRDAICVAGTSVCMAGSDDVSAGPSGPTGRESRQDAGRVVLEAGCQTRATSCHRVGRVHRLLLACRAVRLPGPDFANCISDSSQARAGG